MDKYSVDQIYYKLEDPNIQRKYRILGDSSINTILANTLSCLSKDLVDKVLKEVYFLPHNPGSQRGFYMTVPTLMEEMVDKKAIIYFSFDEDEEAMTRTILHEIAHHVLNHEGGGFTGNPDEEREAHDLVNKWIKP